MASHIMDVNSDESGQSNMVEINGVMRAKLPPIKVSKKDRPTPMEIVMEEPEAEDGGTNSESSELEDFEDDAPVEELNQYIEYTQSDGTIIRKLKSELTTEERIEVEKVVKQKQVAENVRDDQQVDENGVRGVIRLGRIIDDYEADFKTHYATEQHAKRLNSNNKTTTYNKTKLLNMSEEAIQDEKGKPLKDSPGIYKNERIGNYEYVLCNNGDYERTKSTSKEPYSRVEIDTVWVPCDCPVCLKRKFEQKRRDKFIAGSSTPGKPSHSESKPQKRIQPTLVSSIEGTLEASSGNA